MEKIIKRITCLFILASILMIAGCSEEDNLVSSNLSAFDDLTFVVNVEANGGTRSATSKKDWSKGDKIIVSIDGSETNICNLEYIGNKEWSVTKHDHNTCFSYDTGKLSAVYADKLTNGVEGITTEGDILYTDAGTYNKSGNVVVINLIMDKRPISRIAVVGADTSCWIDNLRQYLQMTSLSTPTWASSCSNNSQSYKEIYGDTCVYYGLLESDNNGSTRVRFRNDNGVTYDRVYTNKFVSPGDYIVIYGPLSDEGAQWNKTQITLNKSTLNLIEGDEYVLTASLSNANATDKSLTWSSSNSNVVSVDGKGNIKANSNGKATIIVKTNDGSAEASCSVTVDDISNFIGVDHQIRASIVGGGTTTYNFELMVYNHYSKTITLMDKKEFYTTSSAVLTYLTNFSASSYSKTNVDSESSSSCMVYLKWNQSFKVSIGSWQQTQNRLTIYFKIKGSAKEYKKSFYLPFTLY